MRSPAESSSSVCVPVTSPSRSEVISTRTSEACSSTRCIAPSGTAAAMQRVLEQASAVRVDITSEREGDVTGTHTLELDSAGDRMVLTHEAKSRRAFAEGAVLASEWLAGKTGFYDFKDIFSQL